MFIPPPDLPYEGTSILVDTPSMILFHLPDLGFKAAEKAENTVSRCHR